MSMLCMFLSLRVLLCVGFFVIFASIINGSLIMSELKEEDIKEFAKTKIKELNKELQKWKNVLDSFSGEEKEIRTSQLVTPSEKSAVGYSGNKIKSNPKTLRERCEKILFDVDVPLTSRDLMNEYAVRYNKKYDFYSFSGTFSMQYRAKNSMIQKFDLPNPLRDVKTIYGLKNWFSGEDLFELYKKKVENKYGVEL